LGVGGEGGRRGRDCGGDGSGGKCRERCAAGAGGARDYGGADYAGGGVEGGGGSVIGGSNSSERPVSPSTSPARPHNPFIAGQKGIPSLQGWVLRTLSQTESLASHEFAPIQPQCLGFLQIDCFLLHRINCSKAVTFKLITREIANIGRLYGEHIVSQALG